MGVLEVWRREVKSIGGKERGKEYWREGEKWGLTFREIN